MIEFMQLQNLKCFEDLKISLLPLTVLTGFNAAGKSTALQSILLVAQALRSNCAEGAIPLNGPFTRMGTPGEVVGDNGSRSMSIELWASDERCRWAFQAATDGQERLSISEVRGKKGDSVFVEGGKLFWPLQMGTQKLWTALRNVIYISAVRQGANDIYPVPDDMDLVHGDVGVQGQFAPWWYARSVDDEVDPARLHPLEAATSLRKQLDAYMSEIFPNAGANAEQVSKASATRLEMRTSLNSGWHRPSNVGYGLTYLFPIFVSLLLAKEGTSIIIDSPEAHLHPSAQSKLGKIFSRFAQCGIQVIVETHSDHLLNGIRLGVKNADITKENVAILFFAGASKEKHGVTSLRIDQEGSLDAWPKGFFDQSEIDMALLVGWDDEVVS